MKLQKASAGNQRLVSEAEAKAVAADRLLQQAYNIIIMPIRDMLDSSRFAGVESTLGAETVSADSLSQQTAQQLPSWHRLERVLSAFVMYADQLIDDKTTQAATNKEMETKLEQLQSAVAAAEALRAEQEGAILGLQSEVVSHEQRIARLQHELEGGTAAETMTIQAETAMRDKIRSQEVCGVLTRNRPRGGKV